MIQSALSKAKIRNIRIDGRVSARARQDLLQRFRENDIAVALLTTDCGAVGYAYVRSVARTDARS